MPKYGKTQSVQAARVRPAKLTKHMKELVERQAQEMAQNILNEIYDKDCYAFHGAKSRSPGTGSSEETLPVSTPARGQSRLWMIDSGSSIHLLRKSDLSNVEKENVRTASNRMKLSTANGIITVDKSLQFNLSKLHLQGEAYIFDHAPPGVGVLSQGKTVRENKCSYWWRPIPGRDDISQCTMYLPGSSTSIELHIEDDVPLINSAVVAAAIQNPRYPMVENGDYRLEKATVNVTTPMETGFAHTLRL